MAKIIIMNVGIDKTFLNLNLARKLLIMVKNAGSKNKRGRLMKNMKSPNSGLIHSTLAPPISILDHVKFPTQYKRKNSGLATRD